MSPNARRWIVVCLAVGAGLAGVLFHALFRMPRPATLSGDELRRSLQAAWLAAPFLTGLVLLLSLAPVIRAKKWFRGVVLAGGCAAFVTLAGWLGLSLSRDENVRNWTQAEALKAALFRYRERDGRYPMDLRALVPDFLVEIPRGSALWSVDFNYVIGDPFEFRVTCQDSKGTIVVEAARSYLSVDLR